MVETFSLIKDGRKRLQPNFCVDEMRSQCGADKILIDTALVEYLQRLRDCLGLSALKIVSGYRTAEYNAAIGGASESQHLLGKAADVCAYKNGERLAPKYLCCAAEVLGMDGIGLIQTCAHLDTRGHQAWFDENYSNTKIESFGHKSWFTYCGVDNLDFMKNPFEIPNETLEKGDKGEGVRWLQFDLIKNGFLDLLSEDGRCNIDGIYGDDTEKAVKAYLNDIEETVETMNFSGALEAVKNGKKVKRHGVWKDNFYLALQKPDANSKMTQPYLYIENPEAKECVPWFAMNDDILAEDWVIVD